MNTPILSPLSQTPIPRIPSSSPPSKNTANISKQAAEQTETWEGALNTFKERLSDQNPSSNRGNSPLFINTNKTTPSHFHQPHESPSEKENFITQKKHALLKAAQSFEALLVYQMFKAMEKNLEGDKLLGENQATKIFKDFLTNENSLLAVKSGSGSLGLAKIIYEENVKHIF